MLLLSLWLRRDDLENICTLLFRFLGYGFRLAMSNVGWLVTQKFVILLPDPIGVSPSWSLRGGTRVSSGLIARQIRSWRRASRQGLPCSCLFFKTHQIGLLLCFCAEPQTSREVDQGREAGLTRQCNGRLCVRLYSFWFTIFYHKTTVAGDAAAAGGAGGALRCGASLVTVDVMTGHICSVSFCFCVPTERDKYVWLQSRRRP